MPFSLRLTTDSRSGEKYIGHSIHEVVDEKDRGGRL